ncbi:hypothetical protein HAX54_016968, partial [Datura stramonium]|nr:hypothetical protein [Datura stramonium]
MVRGKEIHIAPTIINSIYWAELRPSTRFARRLRARDEQDNGLPVLLLRVIPLWAARRFNAKLHSQICTNGSHHNARLVKITKDQPNRRCNDREIQEEEQPHEQGSSLT